ncbi:MAG: DUF4351 domain-containing protein [Gammaproteobacteria bacterium]|nr:DUF4351 domain-containing protein [Gammaproteobacteria bacterium]MYB36095.1 DUF4351 domain-containing protein [Gammaproteobacteria bacterium]
MANVSHDQNFKNLIVDYPRDALAFFAAEEAPEPGDDVHIAPLRQEQLKERLGDRFRELDAPLEVQWADGRRDAVLFVVEEETQPRRFSPHRLAHYCLDLAQMFGTNRVVPVTIFLRGSGAAPASLALGTERNTYLTFRHLACRLAETPYEDWRDSGNVAALVNLPNMRVPPERRVDAYADAVRGLAAVETDLDRRAKYMEFIDAYADLDEDEYRRYEREYAEESTAMAGAIQRARNEGRQEGRRQGRQEGRQQGRQEGTRSVLERQLQRRFGLLSPRVAERLRRASAGDLETWADQVLDADSLDEVFRPSR